MTRNRIARAVALLGLAGLLTLPLAAQAGARIRPSTSVPGAAPGGHLVLGRNIERIAASNQGVLRAEAGVQVYDAKAALWAKVYADAHETDARFSRLHIQELGYRAGRRYVTRQYRSAAARGPTHRAAGGKTVYYRGQLRPVHPDTVSFRVSVWVSARKSGTWLETSRPKPVCSFEVDRARGQVLAAPLC